MSTTTAPPANTVGINQKTVRSVATETGSSPVQLVPGTTLARALYETMTGRRVTLIDSAPGAGKSTLIVDLARWVGAHMDLRLTIATPTRSAAITIAEKIADADDRVSIVLALSGYENPTRRSITAPGHGAFQGENGDIVVRTMASLGMDTKTSCDLLVVDEAYQSTFAQLMAAGKSSEQVLLVGDPGQIGPVTTADTTVFDGRDYPPHMRAPDALRGHPSAMTLHLDKTYRLGAESVRAIAPLYDFAFGSGRPDRRIEGHREIESQKVPSDDPLKLYEKVSSIAASFIGKTLVESSGTRRLRPSDIAVVAGDNLSVNAISGFLSSAGHFPGITVGTADRLQGGQWHAVVALDPLAAAATVSEHHLSAGRLCVMASRQMSHLTWVHDGKWDARISAFETDEPKESLMEVRRRLTGSR